jgi:prepilin-type N-terminal cleavage/methylation domain-containing protein
MKNYKTRKSGFTLVEIMVVVVILALAMYAAAPMFSGAAEFQIQSAANMVAADLEYAKSMAISRQQYYGVVFDPAGDKYDVVDINDHVIEHPVKMGYDYTVDFSADGRLKKVDLVSTDFSDRIYFNYLGMPCLSKSDSNQLINSGNIRVSQKGGGVVMTIIIEPVTGYIRIQ